MNFYYMKIIDFSSNKVLVFLLNWILLEGIHKTSIMRLFHIDINIKYSNLSTE